MLSLSLLLRYIVNISFVTTGLYVFAPVYQTLTRSISSDSIWACCGSLSADNIRMQEYKFEINGPWDEAKLCFDITD
ncbi:hypothetical protein Bca52824_028813 [Brassica carinata]|uniref:Uncharacterized protein n=1 Tax=Brassica carinata TaxID=52824 RepID=A0A8X7VCV7_BRACI|nr:hypothetical protein Bca52824_028813 [Brassica carinata]